MGRECDLDGEGPISDAQPHPPKLSNLQSRRKPVVTDQVKLSYTIKDSTEETSGLRAEHDAPNLNAISNGLGHFPEDFDSKSQLDP